MPLSNVTLLTPFISALQDPGNETAGKVVLTDTLVRVNGIDISSMCTHVSVLSRTDERDVTTYGARNRMLRLDALYRIEVSLSLLLGTDDASVFLPTSTGQPTSTLLLTGDQGDVWTGIQFDDLFDSDLPTTIEVAPRRFPVPPVDQNPMYSVPCRITKYTRLVGGIGEPAEASLTMVGVAALSVRRTAGAFVTPPIVLTPRFIPVVTAVEVSVAQPLALRIPLVRADELEAAQTVQRRGQIVQAVETNTAQPITGKKVRTVGQVTE